MEKFDPFSVVAETAHFNTHGFHPRLLKSLTLFRVRKLMECRLLINDGETVEPFNNLSAVAEPSVKPGDTMINELDLNNNPEGV